MGWMHLNTFTQIVHSQIDKGNAGRRRLGSFFDLINGVVLKKEVWERRSPH